MGDLRQAPGVRRGGVFLPRVAVAAAGDDPPSAQPLDQLQRAGQFRGEGHLGDDIGEPQELVDFFPDGGVDALRPVRARLGRREVGTFEVDAEQRRSAASLRLPFEPAPGRVQDAHRVRQRRGGRRQSGCRGPAPRVETQDRVKSVLAAFHRIAVDRPVDVQVHEAR